MIVKFIGREIKLVAICETWEYQPPTQQQLVKWFVRCGSEGMHGLSYILPSWCCPTFIHRSFWVIHAFHFLLIWNEDVSNCDVDIDKYIRRVDAN